MGRHATGRQFQSCGQQIAGEPFGRGTELVAHGVEAHQGVQVHTSPALELGHLHVAEAHLLGHRPHAHPGQVPERP